MFDPFDLIPLAVGLLVGALLSWLWLRATIQRQAAELSAAERFRERAQTAIEEAGQGGDQKLRETFTALSSEALQANSAAFIEQARAMLGELQAKASGDLDLKRQEVQSLVEPIRTSLAQVDEKIAALDRSRAESHGALEAMLKGMGEAQKELTAETHSLVTALRNPTGRGQWGELQLERVVELAGMVEHCDFATQHTVTGENGTQRPDLVVHLPGDKVVVVDAKAPLSAYLEAIEASDERARDAALDSHARQVRSHVEQLAKRDYSDQFSEAPDFVVLFLPGEAFFAAACQRDPSLLEYAVSKGVVPASPTTLITLLKAVNYGWQQERIARNAEAIRDAGMELYRRMAKLGEHLSRIRRGLSDAVGAYNNAVGSIETRILPAARRFRDLELDNGHEIEPLETVSEPLRVTSASELVNQ